MVSDSDAIIDPWTVVVKSVDAPFANGAVLGPARPHYFAVGTHLTSMRLAQQINERIFLFDKPGIRNTCNCEKQAEHKTQPNYSVPKVRHFLIRHNQKQLSKHNDQVKENEEHLGFMVLLQGHHWGFEHATLEVGLFFEHGL